jgi:hypothetical protein
LKTVIPYGDRKEAVLRVLEERAKARALIKYAELGKLVGKPAIGPWKALLDSISQDEKAAGRPDITHLVVSSATGYPSQIDFEDARSPTALQKAKADEIISKVFAYYATPVVQPRSVPG